MSVTAEGFMRDFLARQREIGRRSLAAVAAMSQANMELILLSGTNPLQSSRVRDVMSGETEPPQEAPSDGGNVA